MSEQNVTTTEALALHLRACAKGESNTNDRGNLVQRFHRESDRYYYDALPCSQRAGWLQYDTSQDAWYFGVWVHPESRQTFTYCEGDLLLVTCPDEVSYKAELQDMAKHYGPPPPFAVTIDGDGAVTEHYEERPQADDTTPSP